MIPGFVIVYTANLRHLLNSHHEFSWDEIRLIKFRKHDFLAYRWSYQNNICVTLAVLCMLCSDLWAKTMNIAHVLSKKWWGWNACVSSTIPPSICTMFVHSLVGSFIRFIRVNLSVVIYVIGLCFAHVGYF